MEHDFLARNQLFLVAVDLPVFEGHFDHALEGPSEPLGDHVVVGDDNVPIGGYLLPVVLPKGKLLELVLLQGGLHRLTPFRQYSPPVQDREFVFLLDLVHTLELEYQDVSEGLRHVSQLLFGTLLCYFEFIHEGCGVVADCY